jgi:uncharacterized alkaline shock family protein YloU
MVDDRVPGQALVTRRALVDIIRPAVVGSYGVTGFVARSLGARILGWFGLAERGIGVSLREGLTIDLYLTVAYGLPVAEVARQADSAVRYALRRALGREVDRLTIHVGGMSYQPASAIVVPAGQEEPARADASPDPGVGEAVIAGAGHADDRA